MPVAPKSMQDLEQQVPALDPAAVREQVERLVAHPLFANSKRYPALLAYVVEQTLLGNASDLKERSIGIEVFGRSPSYDANADPIVRITAGEVRKRLSQYYYDASHAGELVLELPIGSYVPVFRPSDAPAEPAPLETSPEPVTAPGAVLIVPSSQPTAPRAQPWRLRWIVAGFLVVLAGAIGLVVGLRIHPVPPLPPPSNIDRFWEPVVSSANPATFCLGEPAKNLDTESINDFEAPVSKPQPEKLYVRLHYSGNLALADVITLTRTAANLETKHKSFRVVPASEASFAQLREGPIVLIGAFDNIWTLRVTQKLRFGFESKDGVATLVDRKSPQPTSWATAWDLPYEKLSRDYAIVARIHDSTTGQPVIIAAGISEEGTEAAGEILYNPVYLDSLLAKAPPDWEKKNMEAVIETQVIQGHSGPPNVLAVETW
ncbi:MAG TPA: hypothetical protein VMR02_18280 [Terracidiphilus sp.]|jgi:hypothetical protein|nr:hypothetical protein [Terracidiphilus sp.]